MYIDQDSLGNDVEMFADNKPSCENCSLAMGLPVTTPMAAQELLSEVEEKTDTEINILETTSITLKAGVSELLPGGFTKINVEGEPSMANIPNLTWESSDISVAYVTSEGIVYAQKSGTVTISATSPKDNKITASIEINVVDTPTPEEPEEVLVEEIKLSQASKTMAKGETFTLEVTITPEGASETGVTWSSNSEHATVDSESGLITAVSTGTAKITATAKDSSGVTASCTITVKPTKVTKITVDPATKSVAAGEQNKFTLTANVEPEDADEPGVTWSVTSGEEFATVNAETGEVTPVAAGSATVTATAKDGSGITGACEVTVTA